MKNKKLILIFIMFILTINISNIKGQASSALAGNFPGTGNDYIGWVTGSNAALALPQLDIKNEDNMSIMFYTDAGAGTYNNLRMIIYEDPSTPGASNAGFVGIGYTVPPRHLTITTQGTAALLGSTPSMVELLVAGGIANDNTGRQTVADFQSVNDNSNSIGIRIRGSRDQNQDSDCGYVDFDNYYKTGNYDFNLARISADVRDYATRSGYLQVKTNNSGSLNTAIFADYNGKVGIGTAFNLTSGIFPNTRLEVFDAATTLAQFRITQDYTNATFTNFQVYNDGNLLINPLKSGTGKNVGIGLSTSNIPTEMIDVLGNGRIRGLTTGTNNFLVTAETNGTLHQLSMSTPGNVLHGNGTWSPVGDVTACSGSGGPVNYITKFIGSSTNICNSGIWESPTSPNNIGIGTTSPLSTLHIESPASSPPDYTVFVSNNTSTSGISGAILAEIHTTAAANTRGVYVVADGGTNTNYGLDAFSLEDNSSTNYGAAVRASDAEKNIGVNSEASGSYTGTNKPTKSNYSGIFSATGDGSVLKNYGIEVTASGETQENYGLLAHVATPTIAQITNTIGYAIYGEARGLNGSTGINYAGYFDVAGQANENYGVKSKALDATTNYAVHATCTSATNATDNFGVHTTANNATNNYAVYAVTPTYSNCSTGTTSASCTQAAGFFSGNVFVMGGNFYLSDSTIKTNIAPITNALAVINQLDPSSYTFDTLAAPGISLPLGIQYGLMAQNLENVLPTLVKTVQHPATYDSLGGIVHPAQQIKTINYTSLIPFLIGGMKDQELQIDSLRQLILSCCGIVPRSGNIGGNTKNIERIELKNSQSIILDQNKPNPFAELTDIDYFLPDEVKSAEMIFYNQTGMVLKTVSLNEKGKGTVRVYSPELKNGTYLYTLLVDGKVIETKTMIKAK